MSARRTEARAPRPARHRDNGGTERPAREARSRPSRRPRPKRPPGKSGKARRGARLGGSPAISPIGASDPRFVAPPRLDDEAQQHHGRSAGGKTVIGKGIERLKIVVPEKSHQEGGAGQGGDRGHRAGDERGAKADGTRGPGMEKLGESAWLRPLASAAPMVNPERENPGISAPHWQRPMNRAWPQLSFSNV